MRKLSILAIAIIVLIPLGLMAQDEGFYPYSYARLSYVNGSVFVQRTSDLGYEKGEVNLALVQGDKMGTEAGQAEIHFGRRNYLRLADNTKVEFAILPQEGDEHIKLHITEGSAYLRVSYLATDKGIEVHTPDASFYVLEEGLYRFDVRLDRETEVFVREGSLEAAGEDGSVVVRAQESLRAADGRFSGDPEYSYSQADNFDDWNGSRDAQLSQRSARQNLPSDIAEYEEELDQNGQWVYERPYGNVWVPNVSYADWRPYLYGRWVWYPVIGWNWVSSESWGWSVYHYGRWHWRFGLGWYWIPQNHWGPAWVHWWSDSSYIGWCPLSWYNRPVVILNNRFYDRYYDPYFSAHNRALSVIRRDQLQSHDIARRQIGSGELDRIGRVALKGEQPRILPRVDNSRPQAIEARRALAVRPGSRSVVKSVPPANSVTSSRLRQAGGSQSVRAKERSLPPSDPNRNAVSRPVIRDPGTGSRAIRSYPSQSNSGNRNESGASASRRVGAAAPVRGSGSSATREIPSLVAPSSRPVPASPKAESKQNSQKVQKNEGESKGAVIKKGETIKNYPSSVRSESAAQKPRTTAVAREARQESGRASAVYPSRSNRTDSPGSSNSRVITSSPNRSSQSSAGRSQAPSLSSRPAASRPAPHPSSPSYSASRSSSSRTSSPSYSRPSSARSSSASPSRTTYSSPSRSASRSPSYSQPRSSSSAPSRSSGSSSRSISAPKSSGSSSGRSSSVTRSGSSSSSSRSSFSSSRSSSSSSKSGKVKRKG